MWDRFGKLRGFRCEIHGYTNWWWISEQDRMCSQCLSDVLVMLAGSIGGSIPSIRYRNGINYVDGVPAETLLILRDELLENFRRDKFREPYQIENRFTCKECGILMTVDKDDGTAKCGNVMCDVFNEAIFIKGA